MEHRAQNIKHRTWNIEHRRKNAPCSMFYEQCSRGFSLVELLVVLSIFSLITSVVLVQGSRFDSSILLTNLAYETALTIREAQVYGISVRGETGASGLAFQHAYGVYFGGDDKSIVSFIDRTDNRKYDLGTGVCREVGSECLDILKINRGNRVAKFCAISAGSSSTTYCTDDSNSSSHLDDLSITFKRPNPDAVIKNSADILFKSASIVLSSADGLSQRTLNIEATGQISIE